MNNFLSWLITGSRQLSKSQKNTSLNPKTPATVLNNRYEVQSVLKEGEQGFILLAKDKKDGKKVVLKQLKDQIPYFESKKEVGDFFHEEFNLLRELSHPSLTRVYDFFEQDGKKYFAMQHVEGESLRDKISAGKFNQTDLLTKRGIAKQIGEMFDYLHRQNPPITYCGLESGDIIITPQGKAVLADMDKLGRYAILEKHGFVPIDVGQDNHTFEMLLREIITGYNPADHKAPSLPPYIHGKGKIEYLDNNSGNVITPDEAIERIKSGQTFMIRKDGEILEETFFDY